MANHIMDKFTFNGETYVLQDNVSGYVTSTDIGPLQDAALAHICYGTSTEVDDSSGVAFVVDTGSTFSVIQSYVDSGDVNAALLAVTFSYGYVCDTTINNSIEVDGVSIQIDFGANTLFSWSANQTILFVYTVDGAFIPIDHKQQADWNETDALSGAYIKNKPTIPTASTTNPSMDGTASYGSGTVYARSNHVHPTDTSRQATLVSGTNIKTINGSSILGSGDLTISSGSKTTWYGTSSTAGNATIKVVDCDDFALVKGAIIMVLFTTANTQSAIALNVNSTGEHSVYVGASAPNTTTNVLKWSANTLLTFMYDGYYFRYISSVAGGSLNQPDGAGSWYGTSSTVASTTAKTSTITNYRLTPGARVSIAFSTANTVSGAITLNVNSTGAKTIYYNNVATSASNPLLWDAGETLTFVYSGSYYYFVARSKASAPTAMTTSEVDAAVQAGWGTSLANADNVAY